MRRPLGIPTWAAALAVAVLALPRPSAAQEMKNWGGKRYPALDHFDQKALADVTSGTGHFHDAMVEAAKLHAVVVKLRPYDDAHRFACIRKEAQLMQDAGQPKVALQYMVEAATYARDTGIVYDASMTYIDAAVLAARLKEEKASRQLALRARLLSYSPTLSHKERSSIDQRLGELPYRLASAG